MVAVIHNRASVIPWFVSSGEARISNKVARLVTALAFGRRYSILQELLEECGESRSVWDRICASVLVARSYRISAQGHGASRRCSTPPHCQAISTALPTCKAGPADLCIAALHWYLEQQHALIEISSLLSTILQSTVATYAELQEATQSTQERL
jgi:hypothetical protein